MIIYKSYVEGNCLSSVRPHSKITTKHLQMIFNWIKLNQQVLVDYENGVLDDTREFLHRISPI